MTTDWVRQRCGAAPQRHEVIGPEPCPLLPAAVASEPYGGTQNDDKLPKAPFPVFVWRVALLCCGNCYLVVTKRHSRTLGVLPSGANGALLRFEVGGLFGLAVIRQRQASAPGLGLEHRRVRKFVQTWRSSPNARARRRSPRKAAPPLRISTLTIGSSPHSP